METSPHPYDIIATLGPTSADTETWHGLIEAGANAFRLNTSHLSLPQIGDWLERLDPFLATVGPRFPIVLDLQGSKWRLGAFSPFDLTAGETVTLLHADTADQPGVLPVPHADFFDAAPLSDGEIVLNDAKIRLGVQRIQDGSITARVLQGGPIAPNKGITFTASEYRKETLSEKDRVIFETTRGFGAIRYAISYLRDAAEMARYRALFGPSAILIAKLERGPAVDAAAEIARSANELWLCRGDLGAELGLPGMARATASFSALVPTLPVPSIMAGQVLEHMTASPAPTRSEMCYLYDTLARGYRGFVLSDETAIGRYPVESCRAAALFRR